VVGRAVDNSPVQVAVPRPVVAPYTPAGQEVQTLRARRAGERNDKRALAKIHAPALTSSPLQRTCPGYRSLRSGIVNAGCNFCSDCEPPPCLEHSPLHVDTAIAATLPNDPAGQLAHTVAPAREYLPAGQAPEQLDTPSADNAPK